MCQKADFLHIDCIDATVTQNANKSTRFVKLILKIVLLDAHTPNKYRLKFSFSLILKENYTFGPGGKIPFRHFPLFCNPF